MHRPLLTCGSPRTSPPPPPVALAIACKRALPHVCAPLAPGTWRVRVASPAGPLRRTSARRVCAAPHLMTPSPIPLPSHWPPGDAVFPVCLPPYHEASVFLPRPCILAIACAAPAGPPWAAHTMRHAVHCLDSLCCARVLVSRMQSKSCAPLCPSATPGTLDGPKTVTQAYGPPAHAVKLQACGQACAVKLDTAGLRPPGDLGARLPQGGLHVGVGCARSQVQALPATSAPNCRRKASM